MRWNILAAASPMLAAALLAWSADPLAAQQPFSGQVGRIPTPTRPIDKNQAQLQLCSRAHWPKCENHKQYDCWQYFNTQKSTCRTRCQPSGTC